MTGYESVANNLLRQGVKNTSVIYDRLKEVGYKGSLSGIKRYVAANKNLLPPKRYAVEPQGSRGFEIFHETRGSIPDGLGLCEGSRLFRA